MSKFFRKDEIFELSLTDKGRLYTLALVENIPTKKEKLMELLEFKTKDALRHFLTNMEKAETIILTNKWSKDNIFIYLSKKCCDYMCVEFKLNYVYRLYKDDEIVYIGKSKNIRERIKSHKKNKDFNYYDYSIVNDSNMHLYEIYYINKYKPNYNKSCKGKSDMVNIKLKELEFTNKEEITN